MENTETVKNNFSNKKWLLVIALLIVCLVGALFILLYNKDDEPKSNLSEVESKNLTSFKSSMEKVYEEAESMEPEEAKDYIINGVYDNLDAYGGNDSVDYLGNSILNELFASVETTTKELVANLENSTKKVEEQLYDGLLGEIDSNVIVKDITMRSTTVCNDGDIDAKFCVNKLNAKVYVVDPSSDKWAVVLHGNMMSGSLIYRTLGKFYTEQGYNVLAPDLRGFGSSEGSVAMGYLESLDVYDWIKDLNEKYNNPERYNVNKKPAHIVVHGVSLGGATTLQLATNPDIAAAKKAPYTKNLTQLNVKGFVDDCGYTSMSGIITGMLSAGDITELTSMLNSLDIDKETFMKKFNEIAKELNLKGFENIDFNNIDNLNTKELNDLFNKFSQEFKKVEDILSKYENSNGTITVPGYDKEDLEGIYEQFKNQYDSITIPSIDDIKLSLTANTTTKANTSEILDGIIGKLLIKLVGVGLNDDNYAYYSDVFAKGRQFPAQSKVMIIHGTADTTVPHSNADTVAKNISPAILVHKWDATLEPHAFIVVGKNKDKYIKLISNYTKCITDNTCIKVERE